ncbi:hypothetical protein KA005_84245, partial [bacterium]|nr:hypothetical protein [bacterium]
MPFEVDAWIPVESEEPEQYETVQEALDVKASQELMHPENRYEIVDTETDEVVEFELLPSHVPVTDRKVICPHCNKNLLEVGIEEVLEGGLSRTPVEFSKTGAIIGTTTAENFNEQWISCKGCNEDIHGV